MSMAHSKQERNMTLWLWAAKDCISEGRNYSPTYHLDSETSTASDFMRQKGEQIKTVNTLELCRVCGSRKTSDGYGIMEYEEGHGSRRSCHYFERKYNLYYAESSCHFYRCAEVCSYYGINIDSHLYTFLEFHSGDDFKKRFTSLQRELGIGKREISKMRDGQYFDAMLIVMIKRGLDL